MHERLSTIYLPGKTTFSETISLAHRVATLFCSGHVENLPLEGGLMEYLISLLSGGVGGNIFGALMKNRSMGAMLNTVLGAVGGLAGGALGGSAMFDTTGANIGASAVGGILLPLIASFFKKKSPAS
jgi:uncharacterized membrane protein YeaQ/YmgE (transglycosylase-associated protein family)